MFGVYINQACLLKVNPAVVLKYDWKSKILSVRSYL